jgi:tRNA A-37 threonylcarbamoyl transferase component Bud32
MISSGKKPAAVVDVAGLGSILHLLLIGKPPEGPQIGTIPAQAIHLGAVLAKSLGLDLSNRYRNVQEFIQALSEANRTRVSGGHVVPGSNSNLTPVGVRTLGPWELQELIGEGAMGQVFLAKHTLLGRQAAIKVLRPEQYQREDLIQRFFQEARSVNQINHEHIVEISDFGQELGPDGKPTAVYFVMELLQGGTLTSRLAKGTLNIERSVHVVKQLASALEAAHKLGVVHRDVKTDNVFLVSRHGDAEYVKVLDFGVAKLTQVGTDAPKVSTMDGAIIGTPDDEVINVEIRGIEGRHILWISPQGGMGVPFDDALLAAVRAVYALTAPDETPALHQRIATADEDAEHWHGKLREYVQRAIDANKVLLGLIPADAVKNAINNTGITQHFSLSEAAEILFSTTVADLVAAEIESLKSEMQTHVEARLAVERGAAEDLEILAAKDERIADLKDGLRRVAAALKVDAFDASPTAITRLVDEADKARSLRSAAEADVAALSSASRGDVKLVEDIAQSLGMRPEQRGAMLQRVEDLIDAEARVLEATQRNVVTDLSEALGVDVDHLEADAAYARLLDKIRERTPVDQVLSDVRRRLSDRFNREMSALDDVETLLADW